MKSLCFPSLGCPRLAKCCWFSTIISSGSLSLVISFTTWPFRFLVSSHMQTQAHGNTACASLSQVAYKIRALLINWILAKFSDWKWEPCMSRYSDIIGVYVHYERNSLVSEENLQALRGQGWYLFIQPGVFSSEYCQISWGYSKILVKMSWKVLESFHAPQGEHFFGKGKWLSIILCVFDTIKDLFIKKYKHLEPNTTSCPLSA